MKKAKGEIGSKSMDRISELPKEILQRILYFLSQEEAVRTSVLSKSWRYSWCTRPNLNFSEATSFKGNNQGFFLSVVDDSLQRYSNQSFCLEEFHLSLSIGDNYVSDHESVSFLEKWIPLLTNMGVKEFHLSILSENRYVDLNVDLPSVVFKAEPLKLLHLRNCKLSRKNIPENIPFVRLQVLRLHRVLVKNEIFEKIISSCPLLADMLVQNCKGLKTIKLENKLHKYLKYFTFINLGEEATHECSIEIDDVPTLEMIMIMGSNKVRFPSNTKFINLKDLSLHGVEISSNPIDQSQLLCIDAPNIEYFDYSGSFIPSISFTRTSGRLNLNLNIKDLVNAQSWFLGLSKLLQALRQCQIILNIFQGFNNNLYIEEDILVQDIINGGNRPVVVDHLHIDTRHLSSGPSVLNVLFCICRPRNITPRGPWDKEGVLKELAKFCCKIQKMRGSGNQEIWQDLEDLTIEGFDESRREWQPFPVTGLSESVLVHIYRFRVRLQWSGQDCESNSKLSKS